MAQLLVRNLESELVRHLKKRAGEHGVSVEEEHRRILREVLMHENGNLKFWEHLSNFPDVGDDSIFQRDRSLPDRASNQHLFDDE
jgi:hypothetical protein